MKNVNEYVESKVNSINYFVPTVESVTNTVKKKTIGLYQGLMESKMSCIQAVDKSIVRASSNTGVVYGI